MRSPATADTRLQTVSPGRVGESATTMSPRRDAAEPRRHAIQQHEVAVGVQRRLHRRPRAGVRSTTYVVTPQRRRPEPLRPHKVPRSRRRAAPRPSPARPRRRLFCTLRRLVRRFVRRFVRWWFRWASSFRAPRAARQRSPWDECGTAQRSSRVRGQTERGARRGARRDARDGKHEPLCSFAAPHLCS